MDRTRVACGLAILVLAFGSRSEAGGLSASSQTTPTYDAFINMGTGPYTSASTLNTGGTEP
jgi:hypothetical protein